MERIKQALEKARIERQMTSGNMTSLPGSRNKAISDAITYTHTRTVHVADNFLHEKRIIAGLEKSTYTDAYKILRTQVLQRLQEKNWNSLAVTSTGVNAGKTLAAINLGISLAMEVDCTVLLVDADLRHPNVHNYFGIDAEYGLSDYLVADKPLSELLVHPHEIPGFVLLPGGKPLTNSAEMLNSPKMIRLVNELKAKYPSRIILFDLPPLLSSADTLAFSPYVDAAVLVVEEGKTTAEEVKRAIGLLQGTNLIGTVLNKAWIPSQKKVSNHNTRLARLKASMQMLRLFFSGLFNRLRRKKN
jgi:capsular exopolysaccharide synthesis family protein